MMGILQVGHQKSLKKAGAQGQTWLLSFLDCNGHYKFWAQNVQQPGATQLPLELEKRQGGTTLCSSPISTWLIATASSWQKIYSFKQKMLTDRIKNPIKEQKLQNLG